MNTRILLSYITVLALSSCQQPKQSQEMESPEVKKNELICDPDSGVCEIPNASEETTIDNMQSPVVSEKQKIKVVYFTDPICSSCWGIEPQLRKLKLAYGDAIDIEYRMGGLLRDWSYNSGGISQPSDVASHWDEVSHHYDMPIDGDVWLEDPLHSSYPPSIAFKAAQLQSDSKAIDFLRKIREMVFLEKKNITKSEHLENAVKAVGLDVLQFQSDYKGVAKALFEEDLKLGQTYRVRGFPTLFFIDSTGSNHIVYGSKPYESYVAELLKINPELKTNTYNTSWESLFAKYNTLTAREYAELSQTDRNVSEATLDALVESGDLKKFTTKNGAIWQRIL